MPASTTSPTPGVGARPRAGSSIGQAGTFLAFAIATLLLTGCEPPAASTPTAEDPAFRPSELTEAGGRLCPRELPLGDDPSGHGFGIEEAASESPTLLETHETRLCQYSTFLGGTTPGRGTTYGWGRTGRPARVAAADWTTSWTRWTTWRRLTAGVDAPPTWAPRWMVVDSHDGDLTGVVVDDYGCRDVRLTDNPRLTPPGADDQDGTVGGVLDGGAAILAVLGVGRSS